MTCLDISCSLVLQDGVNIILTYLPLSSLVDFSFLPYSAAVLDSGGPLRPNLPLVPSFEERGFASYVFLGAGRKYATPFSPFSLIGRGQKESRRRSPAKVSQGFGKKAATESVTLK